jgi:hypothetical protein
MSYSQKFLVNNNAKHVTSKKTEDAMYSSVCVLYVTKN